ncbi:protein singed wings 2 [Nasonia vitripennis]|uniref:Protein singed wings 2 n=1 Tax=Nasonia vitripennis TaxID=7425 RepID=A0A7M7GAH9_NASVI|nr:protein singed wings 2 [Nasonia vitripennis]
MMSWLIVLLLLLSKSSNSAATLQHKQHCLLTDVREASDERDTNELICSLGLPLPWNVESSITVRALTIQNWQSETLDPAAILSKLPFLRRFTIDNGTLSRILTPFPPEARFLETVEITDTALRALPRRAFADLSALRRLDLRNNALVHIDPRDLIDVPTLQDVYLAGNQWSCDDESSSWFANATFGSLVQRIVDREELRCSTPHKGRPLLPVMEVIQRLREECRQLEVCECELVYVVNSAGPGLQARQRQFMAFASVNCSHRGFTDMPAFLPANTTTLHLEGNKISDLTPLKSNPVYKRVLDLYLDNNYVESVALLDGTYWLEQFRLLSLRGNKLTDFPTYALENVLPHSENAVSLYLGNNPWRCDCQFTPGFQELLIKYGNLVKDISDVRCSATGNGEFGNKQIRELSRTEICVPPDDDYWLYPLDILNVLLGSLIFLILGKLLYDYWSFKRTGKLPWLVARIP